MQNGPNSGFSSPSQAGLILNLSKRRVLQMLGRRELAGEKDPDTGRWKIPTTNVFMLKERREREQGQRPTPPLQEDVPSREYVDSLKDQVEDLRQRLDREQEANRENRRIIAGLMNRIPELEAPQQHTTPAPPQTNEDAPGSPQSPGPMSTPTSTSAHPQTSTSQLQGGPTRLTLRRWLRRVINS